MTLRRKLLVQASPWEWARRIVLKEIARSRSRLEAFPPGVARIDAAARLLDSVDRVASVEAAGTVLTPQRIGELADALLTALRAATASLRELSQASWPETRHCWVGTWRPCGPRLSKQPYPCPPRIHCGLPRYAPTWKNGKPGEYSDESVHPVRGFRSPGIGGRVAADAALVPGWSPPFGSGRSVPWAGGLGLKRRA